jgi:hypothetical protein
MALVTVPFNRVTVPINHLFAMSNSMLSEILTPCFDLCIGYKNMYHIDGQQFHEDAAIMMGGLQHIKEAAVHKHAS